MARKQRTEGGGRHGVLHIHRQGAAKVLATACLEPLC
jgi:hypothetical protein